MERVGRADPLIAGHQTPGQRTRNIAKQPSREQNGTSRPLAAREFFMLKK
jgi:hypothetical protein